MNIAFFSGNNQTKEFKLFHDMYYIHKKDMCIKTRPDEFVNKPIGSVLLSIESRMIRQSNSQYFNFYGHTVFFAYTDDLVLCGFAIVNDPFPPINNMPYLVMLCGNRHKKGVGYKLLDAIMSIFKTFALEPLTKSLYSYYIKYQIPVFDPEEVEGAIIYGDVDKMTVAELKTNDAWGRLDFVLNYMYITLDEITKGQHMPVEKVKERLLEIINTRNYNMIEKKQLIEALEYVKYLYKQDVIEASKKYQASMKAKTDVVEFHFNDQASIKTRTDRTIRSPRKLTICEKFMQDKTKNPRTGRTIKENGPVFTRLLKECAKKGFY